MMNGMTAKEQIARPGVDGGIIFKGAASNDFNNFVGSWLISKTYGQILTLVTTIIIGITTVAGTSTTIITISIVRASSSSVPLCLIDRYSTSNFPSAGSLYRVVFELIFLGFF